MGDMSKDQIRHLIEAQTDQDGLFDTGIPGVKLFRATTAVPCAPAVYEPSVIAIVSGRKEAVLEGERFVYDAGHYMCCPMSMPVQAGTPTASAENPLIGVYISLEQRVMTELIVGIENAGGVPAALPGRISQGVHLAAWDDAFTEALLRLVQLVGNPTDMAVLGEARLKELYYAVLKGEAGAAARQAFGVGNSIARSIAHVSASLDAPISIDDMAARAGMSRAVFHRKFKQATAMSPIQFVKSMRLNRAAMKIVEGMTVNAAALEVGYVSPSQFSREFKRMYGHSPRQWGEMQHIPFDIS